MSKHTKGEWFYKRDGFSTVYVEARIGGGWLQEVAACGPTANGSGEQEANARLIASAPDLLEALSDLKRELILSDVDMEYIEKHFRPWLNKAEIAVAKATGTFFAPTPKKGEPS